VHYTDTLPKYQVLVSATPTNYGSASGGGIFDSGSVVSVVATPSSTDYMFVNWMENGVFVSGDAEYTFVLTSNRRLVANFELHSIETYNVFVSAEPEEAGSVTGQGVYSAGTFINIRAISNRG
jgi:hypothetical protein